MKSVRFWKRRIHKVTSKRNERQKNKIVGEGLIILAPFAITALHFQKMVIWRQHGINITKLSKNHKSFRKWTLCIGSSFRELCITHLHYLLSCRHQVQRSPVVVKRSPMWIAWIWYDISPCKKGRMSWSISMAFPFTQRSQLPLEEASVWLMRSPTSCIFLSCQSADTSSINTCDHYRIGLIDLSIFVLRIGGARGSFKTMAGVGLKEVGKGVIKQGGGPSASILDSRMSRVLEIERLFTAIDVYSQGVLDRSK